MGKLKLFDAILKPFTTIENHAEVVRAKAEQQAFKATVSTEVKKPQHVGSNLPGNSGKKISLVKKRRVN